MSSVGSSSFGNGSLNSGKTTAIVSPFAGTGTFVFEADGSQVMGPFTLGVRRQILNGLRALQEEVSQRLISPAEEDVIEDIWRRDLVREECRSALRAAVGLVPEEIAAG